MPPHWALILFVGVYFGLYACARKLRSIRRRRIEISIR